MIKLHNVNIVATIVVCLVMANLSNSAVFYVDPENGGMAGNGSDGRPWKTIEQVFEGKLIQTRDRRGRLKNPDGPIKAGDTILLRSGYHGQINCRDAYNDDYITIAAEDGHTPKVRQVFFAAAGKWIIRGLTVCPEFAPEFKRDRLIYVVDWGGPSSDFVIENNLVLVRHHHGITIYGCQGGVIVNNLAYNPYGGRFLAGIALGTTHGETTSENTIVRNNLVDSKIGLAEPSNTADHNIIVKNPEQYFCDIGSYDMRHKQGSPAIDAGSAESAPKTDINGTKRPQGAGIDVGPYEYQNLPIPVNR